MKAAPNPRLFILDIVKTARAQNTQQLGAKAFAEGFLDNWSAGFRPFDFNDIRCLDRPPPLHENGSSAVRQSAIFDRVGREFVHD